MSGKTNGFRDTLAVPVIKVAMKEFATSAGHVMKHYNRQASSAIEKSLAELQGNKLKFKLSSTGGRAGRGYNMKLNSITGNEHVEITTEGHMNYGVSFSARETTYEATAKEIKATAAIDAGQAFARETVDQYLNELANHGENYIPFNPGNIAASYTAALGKMRRLGAPMGKPNVVTSTNHWEYRHNQRHTNTSNELMSVNESKFNFLDDVNSIPTYLTGDRAGLCLTVYGSCQSGCTIYISGGPDAAGRLIIRRGEVLEIQDTAAIDMMTHRSNGYNRQFVVQRDIWADSRGLAAVSIEPELLPLNEDYSVRNQLGQTAKNGGRKNVMNSPRDGARVIVSAGLQPNAEYEQTIIWYDDAIVMVKADPKISLPNTESMTIRGTGKIADGLGKAYFSMDGRIDDAQTFLRWDYSVDFIHLFPQFTTRMVGIKLADLG